MANLEELKTEIDKIDTPPPQPNCENSYQLLMEAKMDLVVSGIKEQKDDHINLSKLIRDLYLKVYKLEHHISTPNK